MLYQLAKRVLFCMDPETAHSVIMSNLDWAVNLGVTKLVTRDPVEDPIEVMGLRFPNTIGLAAGMGVYGFWYGHAWAGFTPFVIGGTYYLSGKWRTRKHIINK